jgi:hypothetical protein
MQKGRNVGNRAGGSAASPAVLDIETARALAEAGYMPLSEYRELVRSFGPIGGEPVRVKAPTADLDAEAGLLTPTAAAR